MANSGNITVGSGKDKVASQLQVEYQSGNGGSAVPGMRYAAQATLVSGEQPNYALIGIPVSGFPTDTDVLRIALQAGGPTKTPLLTRAKVTFSQGRTGTTVMAGSLVQYKHDFSEDSATAMIIDDKLWLGKVTVTGRMCYDPSTKAHYFDESSPCIPNHMGWPDCIDSPFGPRFAPGHRYGYQADYTREDFTEPAVGKATTRARSWTVGDFMHYLRDMLCVTDGDKRPTSTMDQEYIYNVLPSFITWPLQLSEVVGTERVIKNLVVENTSALRAISLTLRKAGAYDLYMQAQDFQNIMTVVNLNPPNGSGMQFQLPGYYSSDIGQLMNDANTIKGGYLTESAAAYYGKTVICGDPSAIESMLSMGAAGIGANKLEPAWSDADEASFNKYIKDKGSNRTAFEAATKLWPLVYCAYRIKKGAQLWAGTKWSPKNNRNYPRFKPTLLTGAQMNSTNPKDFLSKEIIVEFMSNPLNDPAVASSWISAAKYDGLTLGEDGEIVMFPVLRDQISPCTWYVPTGAIYSGEAKKLPIRINAAVESDWRIIASDETDPNGTKGRIAPQAADAQWLTVAEDLDYVDFLRKDSKPNGTKVDSAFDNFPDRCTAGNELFSDLTGGSNKEGDTTPSRMEKHAAKRQAAVRRIDYGGTIIMSTFSPSIIPGQARTIEGGDTINNKSVVKAVTLFSAQQEVHIELAGFDDLQIYDVPTPGSGMATTKAKENYDSNYSAKNDISYPESPGEMEDAARRNKENQRSKDGADNFRNSSKNSTEGGAAPGEFTATFNPTQPTTGQPAKPSNHSDAGTSNKYDPKTIEDKQNALAAQRNVEYAKKRAEANVKYNPKTIAAAQDQLAFERNQKYVKGTLNTKKDGAQQHATEPQAPKPDIPHPKAPAAAKKKAIEIDEE